jgi:hypothetical protein
LKKIAAMVDALRVGFSTVKLFEDTYSEAVQEGL